VEVRVLGSPDVVDDDGSVLVLAAKQRRLLAALAADPSKTRTVDTLIDALWPERPPAAAAKALQVYVSRLRKELPRGIRIRTDASGYTLELERDALDAARFERLLAEARIAFAEENGSLAVSLLGRALSLWRGPAFGELAYEDFVRAEAERLDELRLLALEQQSEGQLRLGRHAAVVGNLRELAVAHPLRERMQAQLMLALYRCGRQTEALEVYTSLRDRLREELGLEPADELHELQRRILQHDPTLVPAPTAAEQPQTALPTPPNRLLGRRRELAELHRLLLDERVRLLVLTGAGGSGKTRLALEAATRTADAFANGACFVELAPIREPEHLMGAITGALALEAVAGADPLDTLADALRSRELLLILDNAEHLGAAAPLYTRLLARARRLTLLVTSRTVLHVSGEHVYPVEPLSPSAAITLFNERAAEADSRFHPTSEDEQAIQEICSRLDGLPLALELAASRTRTLTPRELLNRLEPRIPLLTGGPRDLPARQQTLRATLDWSYDLLDEHEQRDLRRLAVFAGGCTLEAAEAVCEASVDTLQSLIDESIVRRESARFTMLETIREYALERLKQSHEAEQVQRRHARYFTAFAEATWPRGSRLRFPLPSVRAVEIDNMRAALNWSLRAGETELALRLAAVFGGGTSITRREWLDVLEQALALSGHVGKERRARALRGAGYVASVIDDVNAALRWFGESIELYQKLGDSRGAADAIVGLAQVVRRQGEHTRARRMFHDALALVEDDAASVERVDALVGLAEVARDEGEYALARSLFEANLDAAPRASLSGLGDIALLEGKLDESARRYTEGLEEARESASRVPIAQFLAGLAAVAAREARVERAGRLWGAVDILDGEVAPALIPADRSRYEAFVTGLRPDARFERHYQEGRRLTLEDAAAYGLDSAN
jgi:predicted ATPase/DNA-binding SARP family transcriptional activator